MSVSGHRAVIEVGPGTIRRLCCATGVVADDKLAAVVAAALGGIDDSLAVLDGRPVAVEALWRTVFRSLDCGKPGQTVKEVVVVHPSWWPSSRLGMVGGAARTVADDVRVRSRSWLLTQAVDGPAVVVEIAERLVAIAAAEIVAVPRRGEPAGVADEVARFVDENTCSTTAVALIDAPDTIPGAAALATLIAGALRSQGRTVVEIDDAALARVASSAPEDPVADDPVADVPPLSSSGRRRAKIPRGLAAAAALLAVTVPAAALGRQGATPVGSAPTTFLVEGRVALTVPADWPTQRVVSGPGSARVQVNSPSDPEVALHVTQSRVSGETISGTAERLKRAIGAEPVGVFVDFNPAGTSAGRQAVTYREMRAAHQVRWTVLLDGSVRISIGCQSRPDGEDAVREVCEQAVRSAHAVE